MSKYAIPMHAIVDLLPHKERQHLKKKRTAKNGSVVTTDDGRHPIEHSKRAWRRRFHLGMNAILGRSLNAIDLDALEKFETEAERYIAGGWEDVETR